jgi:hypothetical protein
MVFWLLYFVAFFFLTLHKKPRFLERKIVNVIQQKREKERKQVLFVSFDCLWIEKIMSLLFVIKALVLA